MGATNRAIASLLAAVFLGGGFSCKPKTPAPVAPTAGPDDPHPVHTTSRLAAESAPRYFPSFAKPCDEFTELTGIMKKRMSPTLNEITHLLFHDERETEERLEKVAEACGALLGCSARLSSHRPSFPQAEWPAFDHFLTAFEMNSFALQVAALEGDQDESVHWYKHLKHTCAGCHARFWDPE